MSKTKMLAFVLVFGLAAVNLGRTLIYADNSPGASVLSENFDEVADGGIPTGWTRANTPNFGIQFIGGTNKVAYGDFSHFPYESSSISTLISPTVSLASSTSATLSFDTRCDTEYVPNTDFMTVNAVGSGTSFQELSRWNEPTIDSDTDPTGYAEKHMSVDIPQQFLTSDFRFSFTWTADSNNDGDHNGCTIDNVVLSENGNQSSSTTASSTPATAIPAVTILSPINTNYATSSINIDVTTDRGSTCDFTIDAATDHSPLTPNNSDTEFTGTINDVLTDGNHTFHVYCADFSNNRNDTTNVMFTTGTTTSQTATSTDTSTATSTSQATASTTTTTTSTTTTSTTSTSSAGSSCCGGGSWTLGPTTASNTISNSKADENGDGRVDLMDFNTMMGEWGTAVTASTKSDLNNDGRVDLLDFNLLMANWSSAI